MCPNGCHAVRLELSRVLVLRVDTSGRQGWSPRERTIFWSEPQLRWLIVECMEHCNEHRPDRSLDQQPPTPPPTTPL